MLNRDLIDPGTQLHLLQLRIQVVKRVISHGALFSVLQSSLRKYR